MTHSEFADPCSACGNAWTDHTPTERAACERSIRDYARQHLTAEERGETTEDYAVCAHCGDAIEDDGQRCDAVEGIERCHPASECPTHEVDRVDGLCADCGQTADAPHLRDCRAFTPAKARVSEAVEPAEIREYRAALERFTEAAYALDGAWSFGIVSDWAASIDGYPKWMPSFDEAVTDLLAWRDSVRAARFRFPARPADASGYLYGHLGMSAAALGRALLALPDAETRPAMIDTDGRGTYVYVDEITDPDAGNVDDPQWPVIEAGKAHDGRDF